MLAADTYEWKARHISFNWHAQWCYENVSGT